MAVYHRVLDPAQYGIIDVTTRCTKGGCKLDGGRRMPGAGLSADHPGRHRLESQPSSRTGENSPYGMIGGIEETSASFEARSAPRSYPTGAVVIGQQFPHRTNPDGTNRCAAANSCFWGSPRNPVAASRRKPVS